MKKMMNKGITLSLTTILLFFLLPETVFAYQAAPVAITMPATFITEKSAKLNGQANPSDMPDAYSWFEWGFTGQAGVLHETPRQRFGGKNTLIDRNATITGLAPSTQYFYRQVVENGRGKDIGQTTYFTTKPLSVAVAPLVIVETMSPSVISDTTATIKGYVSPHGDTKTKAWFQWGITQNFENQTPPTGAQSSSGPVESRLNNLTPGTTYFFRVVAENSAGRTIGATRIFLTTGIPPPPPEQPISQVTPLMGQSNDGVARTTTNSGAKNGNQVAQGASGDNGNTNNGLPGVSSGNRPGDIFGALFKKKNTTESNGQDQVAGVAQSNSPLGGFWNSLTGKAPVQVAIEKIGPKDVVAHTPVEYRITYVYQNNTLATNAKLKIILPFEVIYIGDNTNNELLLEEGSGGERTYILPIGRLEKGATRTLSVLGMTTGDAKGFPDARARLEFDSANGTQVVAASGAAVAGQAKKTTAATANSGGLLPSSVFGWLLYVALIVLSFILIRKAKIYYQKRKEEIELQKGDDDRGRLAQLLPQSNQTPQGA